MRRTAVGIIAILLILGAAAFWIWPPGSDGYQQFEAACWRVGALMAVWWLAYKEVERMPGWALATIPLLVIVLAVRPRWFLFAIPVVIALAILKPRLNARR